MGLAIIYAPHPLTVSLVFSGVKVSPSIAIRGRRRADLAEKPQSLWEARLCATLPPAISRPAILGAQAVRPSGPLGAGGEFGEGAEEMLDFPADHPQPLLTQEGSQRAKNETARPRFSAGPFKHQPVTGEEIQY